MKVITKTIYQAKDGKEFINKVDAILYENSELLNDFKNLIAERLKRSEYIYDESNDETISFSSFDDIVRFIIDNNEDIYAYLEELS